MTGDSLLMRIDGYHLSKMPSGREALCLIGNCQLEKLDHNPGSLPFLCCCYTQNLLISVVVEIHQQCFLHQ